MNKVSKHTILVIISIVVFLAILFSATYAILAQNITYNNTNLVAAIGSRPVFTSDPQASLTLNIPYVGGTSTTISEVANNSTIFNIILSTGYSQSTTCTYDLKWAWDSGSYSKTGGTGNEYTISGTDGINSFSEVQLNDSGSTTTLCSNCSITATTSSAVTKIWTITARFYKLTVDQSNHINNTYNGHIYADNVNCSSSTSVDESNNSNNYVYWYIDRELGSYDVNSMPTDLYTSGGSVENVLFDDSNLNILT